MILIILGGSATVSAHSYFVQSDPADGSILERAPQNVVLVFSSSVSPDFTSIQLVEARGAIYVPSAVRGYTGQPNIVVVRLPVIPTGSYRLTFSTRDSVDLHVTAGTIVFGVGMAPASLGVVPSAAPPQPSEFLLRWLALAGLAGILGGLSIALMVTGPLPVKGALRARVQRSLFGLALAGAGMVLVGETGMLAVQGSSLGPLGPSIARLVTGSEFGTRWLVTVLLVAGLTFLLTGLWMASRRRQVPGLLAEFRRRGAWALVSTQVRALLLCAALTAALAFSGHVAGASGTSIGGVTLLALHLGAMGVWAGGVVALALAVLALRRATGRVDRPNLMALIVGFGPIAAISFITLAATGLLLSGIQVASVTALLSTEYGAVLVAKVGLIGAVAIFGLRHARWTWRGLARRLPSPNGFPKRLPLTITLEATGAMVVVLLASVLGASAPAQGPQFSSLPSEPAITQLTREQDGLLITLSVKPNRPGPNLVSVLLVNTRWPEPAPVQHVTVMVQRPGETPRGEQLATTRSGPAFDAGSIKLSTGDVRFTVRVVRPGLADSVANLRWRVAPLEVPRAPVVLSNQPIAPLVDLVAALMVAVALFVVVLAVLRNRGRRAQPRPVEAPTSSSHRDVLLQPMNLVEGHSGRAHNGAKAHGRRRTRYPGAARALHQGEVSVEKVIAIE